MTTAACELVSQDLPAYAQRRLDPAVAAPVERHLKTCSACQKELLELEKLDQLLAEALPAITPSPTFASTFANRLAAEIVAEEEKPSVAGQGFLSWLFRPWLVPAVAVTALIAIVVISSREALRPEDSPVVAVDTGSKGAPPQRVAAQEPKEAPKAVANASGPGRESGLLLPLPPADLVSRPDLFIDYAIIEQLDLLESDSGSGSAG